MIKAQFRNIIFVFLFLFSENIYAQIQKQMQKPVKIGNFALPYSQQPGPLVSIGENILPQGQFQAFTAVRAFFGRNNHYTLIEPSLLFGITDSFSVLASVPVSPGNQAGKKYSSGLNDALFQFEYAFWSLGTPTTLDILTAVASVIIPSGSFLQTPPTGLGSTSFLLGATFDRTEVYWFLFGTLGTILTTNANGTKSGNQLLYQFGFGRNIPSPPQWIFAWIVEGTGNYYWKNRVKSMTDNNSGGNVIYVTPSLFFSNEKFIFQIGAGYPVVQQLNGNQNQFKEFLHSHVSVTYTF